jgi:cell pole-organizing protein PopZ
MRQSGEPSVEEILDSIKKVIARDSQAALRERERHEHDPDGLEPASDEEAAEVLELGEEEVFRGPEEEAIANQDVDPSMTAEEGSALPLRRTEEADTSYAFEEAGFGDLDDEAESECATSAATGNQTAGDGDGDDDGDGLTNGAASARVQASFASLAGALAPPDDGDVDRKTSLEDLVRALLRPMLAEWLDAHLPDLVERMVQEEIARLRRETP